MVHHLVPYPYFSEESVVRGRNINHSLSECIFTTSFSISFSMSLSSPTETALCIFSKLSYVDKSLFLTKPLSLSDIKRLYSLDLLEPKI